MIRYKKYQFTGENHPLKGLWYARPSLKKPSTPKCLPNTWQTTTLPTRQD